MLEMVETPAELQMNRRTQPPFNASTDQAVRLRSSVAGASGGGTSSCNA
jgi:hypothetical protein